MTTSSLPRDQIVQGNNREVLRGLPPCSIDCCITSPPYWNLREYSRKDEIGQEKTKDQYILALLSVFDTVWKVLTPKGSLWVNIGDTFRHGRAMCIPEDFDYMMRRTRRWRRIQNVIWYKPDSMSESVTKRFSQKYEPFYWYVKQPDDYYFDPEAAKMPVKLSSVQRLEHKFYANKGTEVSRMAGMIGDQSAKIEQYLEKGVNAGDLWIIPTNKEKVKHIAPYPRGLVARPVVATCPRSGVVLDPFVGSGTTCLVARELGRSYIGIDLNPEACDEARERLDAEGQQLLLEL